MLLGVCLAVISDEEDKEIFEMLYMKYRLILLDDAYNIIKDYDYAQDIVQETYYRIAKNMDKIRLGPNPLPLLRTVARNCAFDMYAKLKKESSNVKYEEDCISAECKGFVSDVESKSDADLIADFVGTMPPGYAEVFVLRYVHELTSVQIAGLLDLKAATVRKRLQRIREAVADNLYKGEKYELGE